MNLGELRALSLGWLDDPNGGYFVTSLMNRFLNQAQREVQKRLLKAGDDYYTICVEASTVVNQRDYAFPSDFYKLMRLERITQGSGDTAATQRIYPITRNEMDTAGYNFQQTTGVPYNYIENKNTFSLYPVPNAVKTLRLWYAPTVTDMSDDTDVPDCPEPYHEYIAILAARDGFLKDGRSMAPIAEKLRHYEQMLDDDAESRKEDSPRMVVATVGGFGAL